MASPHLDISLDDLTEILQDIEQLVSSSFGPNALLNMIHTSTGQLVISSDGWSTLDALHLSNPAAKIILSTVKTHHDLCGDQSKSFILMLSHALRFLSHKSHKQYGGNGTRSHLVRVSRTCGRFVNDVLRKELFMDIFEHVDRISLCQENIDIIQNTCNSIVKTTVCGKFTKVIATKIAKLVTDFLFAMCGDVERFKEVLLFVIDNFHTMCTEVQNERLKDSSIVGGFVIQKDFGLNCFSTETRSEPCSVKFVLVDEGFGLKDENTPAVLSCTDRMQIEQDLSYNLMKSHKILKAFASWGINLILSTDLVPEFILALARNYGISVVHGIDEDDLKYISECVNIHILDEQFTELSSRYVGEANACHSVSYGNKRCVHLEGVHITVGECGARSTIRPMHLLLCGPTEAICKQFSTAVLSAIKCLRMWLDTQDLRAELAVLQDASPQSQTYKQESSAYSGTKNFPPHSESELKTVSMNNVQFKKETRRSEKEQHGVLDSCLKTVSSEHFQDERVYSTLPHGMSLHGAGTFEFLVYNYLSKHIQASQDVDIVFVCKMVQQAMLAVLEWLHINSFHEKNKSNQLLEVLLGLEKNFAEGNIVCVNSRSGKFEDCRQTRTVEPFRAKWHLLVSVVELIAQLLRIDQIVSTKCG